MEDSLLEWETYEYPPKNHTTDWYWAVGIIAVSIALVSIIFGDLIFGILILIAAFTLCLYAARPPRMVHFELNRRGLLIDKRLYPYDTIESFWIEERTVHSRLLLKSKKTMMPYIIVPLSADLNLEDLQQFLLQYLKQKEHHEPLSHQIIEYLGF
jgi:hypothetical protein